MLKNPEQSARDLQWVIDRLEKSQSKSLLDNFGIRVPMAELPTWPIFLVCSGALYGSGWPSRFWCCILRPRLQPEQQQLFEQAYQEAARLHRQALLNRVLEAGEGLGA